MKIDEQKMMKQTKSSQPRVMCQFKLYLFTTDRYVSIERPPIHLQDHYNKRGTYCDQNIIANNKENSFWKPAVPNNNSSQTLKPLWNPHLRTRTIASSSQLPKLKQSQNISNYNVFYTWFVIDNTLKIICSKPNIVMTLRIDSKLYWFSI
jgi:hypothetical protein